MYFIIVSKIIYPTWMKINNTIPQYTWDS